MKPGESVMNLQTSPPAWANTSLDAFTVCDLSRIIWHAQAQEPFDDRWGTAGIDDVVLAAAELFQQHHHSQNPAYWIVDTDRYYPDEIEAFGQRVVDLLRARPHTLREPSSRGFDKDRLAELLQNAGILAAAT
jgi:hypothetical protein